MNEENCALKLVDEIILYYAARSKKHQKIYSAVLCLLVPLSYIADKSDDGEASHEIWHSHSDVVEDLNFWDVTLHKFASSSWCFKGL